MPKGDHRSRYTKNERRAQERETLRALHLLKDDGHPYIMADALADVIALRVSHPWRKRDTLTDDVRRTLVRLQRQGLVVVEGKQWRVP